MHFVTLFWTVKLRALNGIENYLSAMLLSTVLIPCFIHTLNYLERYIDNNRFDRLDIDLHPQFTQIKIRRVIIKSFNQFNLG